MKEPFEVSCQSVFINVYGNRIKMLVIESVFIIVVSTVTGMDFMCVDLECICKLCIFNLVNKIHYNKPVFIHSKDRLLYIYLRQCKHVIHVPPCFIREVTQIVTVNTLG